jgi:phosphatidylglycerol:prolipoprotein diacylglycerol transferase
LEGLVLFCILAFAIRRGALEWRGRVFGIFLIGYALARIFVERFRVADAQFVTAGNPLGLVLRFGDSGLSMGQVLTLPMLALGLAFLFWPGRRRDAA